MPRLLLASRGIPGLSSLLGARGHQAVLVPTAANPLAEPEIADEVERELTAAGLDVERLDLDEATPIQMRALTAADVVAVSGGDPFHLLAAGRLFEDALRSVPGSEDVTIPYWDLATPLPDLLRQPPFASYELPEDPGAIASPPDPGTYFPYTTERYPPADIADNLRDFGVLADIDTSLTQSRWGAYNTNGYQDFSIQAHDSAMGRLARPWESG